MTTSIQLTVSLIAAANAFAAGGVPAFPGAEGFGSTTPGGRGGKVLVVTNLNDSGPGSFRAACATPGPRIIVFRVAGLIDLKSPILIREPFVTIAAQSAPGDGICLRGNNFGIATHDVVVRFLRSRLGDLVAKEQDAISVMDGSRNVILDHCSASWSVDEALSPSGDIADVTVQWCMIAESLHQSLHAKGPHGYGSLVRAAGGLTMHHNLWYGHSARNPRLGDNYGKGPFPVFDIRNNVMYNYGGACTGLTDGNIRVNYVENYVKPGPQSRPGKEPIILGSEASSDTRFYISGNYMEGRPDLTADNHRMFDRTEYKGKKLVTIVDRPFPAPPVTAGSAQDAFRMVLEKVGAILPVRDAADRRVVEYARTGQGRFINSQNDVGGWPEYRPGNPPADSDNDGIPDVWESAHHLNPNDPSDAAELDASGYSRIELYLNETAAGHGMK